MSNSLILCHSCTEPFLILRLSTFRTRKITSAKNYKYNSWSNTFDPKEKFELKVSKRCYYFLEPPPKSGPKIAHFLLYEAYKYWPQIQDPQILTVGNPIESKDMRLWGQLFFRGRRSKRVVLILLLRIFPSDQKHSSRNCIKFADVEYRVLKVDSRGEKKGSKVVWHRIKEFDTKQSYRCPISWNHTWRPVGTLDIGV